MTSYSEIHFNKFLQISDESIKVWSFKIPKSNFESKLLRARIRISSTGWINLETVSRSWFDILILKYHFFGQKNVKISFSFFEYETISSQSSVYFLNCNLFGKSRNLVLVLIRDLDMESIWFFTNRNEILFKRFNSFIIHKHAYI